MSLFKPSHLSPNFEEIVYDQPLIISFQVNSNSSTVAAYKLEILHEYNDLYEPEKNIIGTIYGLFQQPLHNKDMAQILLTQDVLRMNHITLEPNKDYKWRIRLYSKNQWDSHIETLYIYGYEQLKVDNFNIFDNHFLPQGQAPNKMLVWRGKDCDTSHYILMSQKEIDIDEVTSYLKTQCTNKTFEDIQKTMIDNYGIMLISDCLEYQQCHQIVSPTMYFRAITLSFQDSQLKDVYGDDDELSSLTVLNFGIGLSYIIDKTNNSDKTYIGGGMIVGSTKQIIWTQKYHKQLTDDKYARIIWKSSSRVFSPFASGDNKLVIQVGDIDYANADGFSRISIPRNAIKKEYIPQLSKGKMYVGLYLNPDNCEGSNWSVKYLRQITSVESHINDISKIDLCTTSDLPYDTWEYLSSNNQTYALSNLFSSPTKHLCLQLFWVQQEKIIQVEQNVGNSSLVKTSFEKPFEYNPVYGQNLRLGFVSDNFDTDRVCIDPIAEFDNSDSFSYIKIVPNINSLETQKQINANTVENGAQFHKIINYVSTTGEVTLSNNMEYIPTIQFMYQIYKRNESDNTKYDYIGGSFGSQISYLGGTQHDALDIFTNHSTSMINQSGELINFDYLFVQPNVAIKEDMLCPMALEIYNNDNKNTVYITNLWRKSDSINYVEVPVVEVVDKLDGSMWLLTVKHFGGNSSKLLSTLSLPQTAYKIYTNFVDSTPEGYFYSRYNKKINFTIHNLNNQTSKVDIDGDNLVGTIVPYRDLLIQCDCQDVLSDGTLLGVNNVPIKEYKIEVMSKDKEVLYSTGEQYDGRLHCQFRGCINQTEYYIKAYIEDNYGKLFTSQIKINIEYEEIVDKNSITITPICEKQAIHIDFTPIKEFIASGDIQSNDINTITVGDRDLIFKNVEQHTSNTVALPHDFSYICRFGIDSQMLYNPNDYIISTIETNNVSDSRITYHIMLDTRPYFVENNVYRINNNYLKFRLRKNEIEQNKTVMSLTEVSLQEALEDLHFEYFLSSTETPCETAIYIAPTTVLEVDESARSAFIEKLPGFNTESMSDNAYEGDILKLIDIDGTNYYMISNPQSNEDYYLHKFSQYFNNKIFTLKMKCNQDMVLQFNIE